MTKTRTAAQPKQLDRLPPHSTEAEMGVLGCILVDRTLYPEAKEQIPETDFFYDERHKVIWESLDSKVDILILRQRLTDRNILQEIGGFSYLTEIQDATPSSYNLSHYLDICRDKYLRRKMIQVVHGVMGKAQEFSGDIDSFLDEVEREVLAVSQSRGGTDAGIIGDCIERVQEKIEFYEQNKGKVTGITTGFGRLDTLTAGLKGGQAIILAARPSCGKTSLGMQIAERAAIELKLPVGVFSMEMDKDALTFRMLCGRAGVDSKAAERGELTPEQMQAIGQAALAVRKAPIHIDDTNGLTINQLRARGRRMWQKHGIKLLVIDYLQLMSCPKKGKGEYNRQQEIGEISAGVKNLARECNIPIILLSQLNREIEKDKGRKPRLSDLRESGNIEQDADLVLMLYNPTKSKDEEEGEHDLDHVNINLLIAKQRNGASDRIVPLTFHKIHTRFTDRKRKPAVIEPEDVPQQSSWQDD